MRILECPSVEVSRAVVGWIGIGRGSFARRPHLLGVRLAVYDRRRASTCLLYLFRSTLHDGREL